MRRSRPQTAEEQKSVARSSQNPDLAKQTGGRFLAPKKEFVCEDDWDPAVHGEFDPSKLVTENIMGQQLKAFGASKVEKD